MNNCYVYRHRRVDNNQIFYIGIGSKKHSNQTSRIYYRARTKSRRNNFWHKIANKTDILIEIIYDNISWEDACELEILLIESYGRRDKKLGNLSNLSDGGEGSLGVIASKETREKMSRSRIGNKQSEESIKLMKNNCASGDTHFKSKLVIDLENGIFYYSLKQASIAINVNYTTLKYYLSGKLKNKTSLIYC